MFVNISITLHQVYKNIYTNPEIGSGKQFLYTLIIYNGNLFLIYELSEFTAVKAISTNFHLIVILKDHEN